MPQAGGLPLASKNAAGKSFWCEHFFVDGTDHKLLNNGQLVAIKGGLNNRWCSAADADYIVCNRASLTSPERFTVKMISKNTFALVAYTNKYCSDNRGRDRVSCDKASVNAEERFVAEVISGDVRPPAPNY